MGTLRPVTDITISAFRLLILALLAIAGCASTPPGLTTATPGKAASTCLSASSRARLVAEPDAHYRPVDPRRAARISTTATRHTRLLPSIYSLYANNDENFVFSPAAIATALTMIRAGADGEAAAQIDRVLDVPAESQQAVQELWYVQAPNTSAENALIFPPNIGPSSPLERTLRSYGAVCRSLDLDSAGASRELNEAIDQSNVPGLEPLLRPRQKGRINLVSYLRFKHAWSQQFNQSNTRSEKFYPNVNTSKSVPMLHGVQLGNHALAGDVELVRVPLVFDSEALPSGVRDAEGYGLVLVLPREGHSLAEVESKLDADTVSQWPKALDSPAWIELTMPRFEVTSGRDLRPALSGVGISHLFLSRDELEPRPGVDLEIGEFRHAATIKVDEFGVNAPPVVIGMPAVGSIVSTRVAVTMNRPFLFLVQAYPSGEVMLVGRITNPSSEPVR